MSLVDGDTYELKQMQPHEYVSISAKDVSNKIIKSEQKWNLHLPITGRLYSVAKLSDYLLSCV